MAADLLRQAQTSLKQQDFDDAILKASKAQDSAKSAGDKKSEVEALVIASSAHLSKGNENVAVLRSSDALNLASTVNDKKTEASALLSLAKAKAAVWEADEAFDNAEKARDMFKEADDKSGEASALETLAKCYMMRGDMEGNAAGAAKNAFALFKKLGDSDGMSSCLKTTKDCFMNRGDMSEAQRFTKQELNAFRKAGDKQGEAAAWPVYIEVLLQKGDIEAAARVARDAADRLADIGENKAQAGVLYTLAEIHLKLTENEEALETAQQSANAAKDAGDTKAQLAALQFKTSVYSAISEDPPDSDERSKALDCLNEVKSALEVRDMQKYQEAKERLGTTVGVTDKDVENVLGSVMNQPEAQNFLAAVDSSKEDALVDAKKVVYPGQVGEFQMHETCYMNFRIGGMGYGPRYQAVKVNCSVGEGEGRHAWAAIRQDSDAETWEQELRLYPMLYDASLHTGTAFGIPSQRYKMF